MTGVSAGETGSTRRRTTSTIRRVGFGVAILVNLILLWLVLVWPGWEAVPVLTAQTVLVVPVVVASLVAGVLVNIVNAITDNRVVRAVGEVITTLLSFAVALRLWAVFPFDFGVLEVGRGLDWELLTRGFLAFVMAACVIAVIVQFVTLGRLVLGRNTSENVVGPH